MDRYSEQQVEQALLNKRKTAPRLTPTDIDAAVGDVNYWNPPGTSLTVCVITLRNGFYVTGESASASLSNFDEEIGKTLAFENARKKIWQLEGYLLRQKLHDEGKR